MLSQRELAHGVRAPHRHGVPHEGNMGCGQSWVNTGLPHSPPPGLGPAVPIPACLQSHLLPSSLTAPSYILASCNQWGIFKSPPGCGRE